MQPEAKRARFADGPSPADVAYVRITRNALRDLDAQIVGLYRNLYYGDRVRQAWAEQHNQPLDNANWSPMQEQIENLRAAHLRLRMQLIQVDPMGEIQARLQREARQ